MTGQYTTNYDCSDSYVSTAILLRSAETHADAQRYRPGKAVSIRIKGLYLLRNVGVAAQFEGGWPAATDDDAPEEPDDGGGIRGPEEGYEPVADSLSKRLLRKNASPRTARNPPTPMPIRGSSVRNPSININPKPTPSRVTPARRYRPCAR